MIREENATKKKKVKEKNKEKKKETYKIHEVSSCVQQQEQAKELKGLV